MADELPLRLEPLRSQWEARGPGLLFGVRRLTSVDWLVPSANVVLLPPVLGGAGQAHPTYNVVTFEAVLANPISRLPEVLRLGWLLAQLNPALAARRARIGCEQLAACRARGAVGGGTGRGGRCRAGRGRSSTFSILAATQWLGDRAAADTIGRWWAGYAAERPGWPAGLEALDRLLQSPKR